MIRPLAEPLAVFACAPSPSNEKPIDPKAAVQEMGVLVDQIKGVAAPKHERVPPEPDIPGGCLY
jgi:hypothetical protein